MIGLRWLLISFLFGYTLGAPRLAYQYYDWSSRINPKVGEETLTADQLQSRTTAGKIDEHSELTPGSTLKVINGAKETDGTLDGGHMITSLGKSFRTEVSGIHDVTGNDRELEGKFASLMENMINNNAQGPFRNDSIFISPITADQLATILNNLLDTQNRVNGEEIQSDPVRVVAISPADVQELAVRSINGELILSEAGIRDDEMEVPSLFAQTQMQDTSVEENSGDFTIDHIRDNSKDKMETAQQIVQQNDGNGVPGIIEEMGEGILLDNTKAESPIMISKATLNGDMEKLNDENTFAKSLQLTKTNTFSAGSSEKFSRSVNTNPRGKVKFQMPSESQRRGKAVRTYRPPGNRGFSYSVRDGQSQRVFGHEASYQQTTQQGSYFVHFSDGTVLYVSYIADHLGYRPILKYFKSMAELNAFFGNSFNKGYGYRPPTTKRPSVNPFFNQFGIRKTTTTTTTTTTRSPIKWVFTTIPNITPSIATSTSSYVDSGDSNANSKYPGKYTTKMPSKYTTPVPGGYMTTEIPVLSTVIPTDPSEIDPKIANPMEVTTQVIPETNTDIDCIDCEDDSDYSSGGITEISPVDVTEMPDESITDIDCIDCEDDSDYSSGGITETSPVDITEMPDKSITDIPIDETVTSINMSGDDTMIDDESFGSDDGKVTEMPDRQDMTTLNYDESDADPQQTTTPNSLLLTGNGFFFTIEDETTEASTEESLVSSTESNESKNDNGVTEISDTTEDSIISSTESNVFKNDNDITENPETTEDSIASSTESNISKEDDNVTGNPEITEQIGFGNSTDIPSFTTVSSESLESNEYEDSVTTTETSIIEEFSTDSSDEVSSSPRPTDSIGNMKDVSNDEVDSGVEENIPTEISNLEELSTEFPEMFSSTISTEDMLVDITTEGIITTSIPDDDNEQEKDIVQILPPPSPNQQDIILGKRLLLEGDVEDDYFDDSLDNSLITVASNAAFLPLTNVTPIIPYGNSTPEYITISVFQSLLNQEQLQDDSEEVLQFQNNTELLTTTESDTIENTTLYEDYTSDAPQTIEEDLESLDIDIDSSPNTSISSSQTSITNQRKSRKLDSKLPFLLTTNLRPKINTLGRSTHISAPLPPIIYNSNDEAQSRVHQMFPSFTRNRPSSSFRSSARDARFYRYWLNKRRGLLLPNGTLNALSAARRAKGNTIRRPRIIPIPVRQKSRNT